MLAFLAALACILTLPPAYYLEQHGQLLSEPEPAPGDSRRQLKVSAARREWRRKKKKKLQQKKVARLLDPKTVELKPFVRQLKPISWAAAPIVAVEESAAAATTEEQEEGKGGGFGVPGLAPYHIREGKCATYQKIAETSRAIRDLNLLGIRAFPRNGFLLGVIRHGGFLPTEQIDRDIGVMYEDVLPLMSKGTKQLKLPSGDDFRLSFYYTKPQRMMNWKNINPLTGEKYPFTGIKIERWSPDGTLLFKNVAEAVYPHHDSTHFYKFSNGWTPWFNARVKAMIKWNKEGANIQLMNTGELLTKKNYKKGKQIATVFNTKMDCMVEKPFYFTTIMVPCDYEVILSAYYGKNWNKVEKRFGRNKRFSTVALNKKENDSILARGALPLCKAK